MPRVPVPAAPSADSPAAPPSAALPDTGFLRQPQVLSFVPISKSTLWRRVQVGSFPEPVKLSTRITVWRAEDLRQNSLARQRQAESALFQTDMR